MQLVLMTVMKKVHKVVNKECNANNRKYKDILLTSGMIVRLVRLFITTLLELL
jgi:hypothetical protein